LRTGTRLAYFAKVPLLEIKEALGHSTLEQTMRYIGLPLSKLAEGQKIGARLPPAPGIDDVGALL
jgi:hypothetical protein